MVRLIEDKEAGIVIETDSYVDSITDLRTEKRETLSFMYLTPQDAEKLHRDLTAILLDRGGVRRITG